MPPSQYHPLLASEVKLPAAVYVHVRARMAHMVKGRTDSMPLHQGQIAISPGSNNDGG